MDRSICISFEGTREGNVTDVVTDTVTDERELYTHARAAQS